MAGIIVLLAALVTFAAPPIQAAPRAYVPPLATPDGLWTWVRPVPFGYPAHAIASPSPGTLFVATGEPDALVTRDGGAGWSWSPTNVTPGFFDGLSSIAFASPREGWAGGDGVLLHTADGGLTWQTQLTAADFTFTHLSFSDVSSGWAAAENLDLPRVFATRNGGQTWTEVALPGENTTFTTLVAQGPGEALLVQEQWQSGIGNGEDLGTRLWRTTDYGAHWLGPVSLGGGYFAGATFVSPEHGWAIIGAALWQSTDGGLSWRRLSGSSRDLGGWGAITSVGNDIWAVGLRGALHSSDGGKTWHKLPGVRGLRWGGNHISFSDRLEGWIASDGRYLHTTDGGKSWRVITDGPKSGVSKLAAVGGGIVWGAAGYVIRSADGGKTWQRLTAPSNLSAVAAASARQAWAVGPRGLILHTADGGRHWTRQSSSATADLADVFFVDARRGWLGGARETLRRTVDGGRHWTKANRGVATNVRQLVFADALHGLAVSGFSSYVLTTANGGRSWAKTRFSLLNYHATAVSMIDATHWLVISTQGASWTTGDGGQTWQRGPDLPKAVGDYLDIARSGSRLCAVTWSGAVATSTDDGATWSRAGAVPIGLMACAAFVGSHTLLVGGSSGLLTRDLSAAPLP
jgi:photosystem II stability/assembly factor-like uncharacterized protein